MVSAPEVATQCRENPPLRQLALLKPHGRGRAAVGPPSQGNLEQWLGVRQARSACDPSVCKLFGRKLAEPLELSVKLKQKPPVFRR